MILVIEPVFANAHHAAVNAGLLQAILLAAKGEPIVFAAHPLHRAAVAHAMGKSDTPNFTQIDIEVKPSGGVSWKRFVSQARTILSLTRELDARLTICLGTTPETLFACRLLAPTRRTVRIIAVLPGNLDQANGWRSRDPRPRWFDDRASLAVAIHPSSHLVVLERSIRRAAIAMRLLPADRGEVWPLPINEREVWRQPHYPASQRIHIGFVGSSKRSKGFGDFLTLSRQIMATSDRYQFSLVGGLYEDSFLPEELGHVRASAGLLERQEILRCPRDINYVCLPLKDETYTFTASGALIDAIAALKSIIALPTPAVCDLFEDGPLGYLCNDLTDMSAVLRDGDRLADPLAYAAFQTNLDRPRTQRLPSALSRVIGQALR
jgi:glycosyltransferase involved in cell wall biosynthesis